MTRQHPPCSTCARFVKSAPGHCTGFDRPAEADDAPCVLFLERGSREARLLAEQQRRDGNENNKWRKN